MLRMKKHLHLLSNIIFYSAIAISVFALGKTYYERSQLPPGVCPVDDNRNLLTVGIVLIIVYLVISGTEWWLKRREQ